MIIPSMLLSPSLSRLVYTTQDVENTLGASWDNEGLTIEIDTEVNTQGTIFLRIEEGSFGDEEVANIVESTTVEIDTPLPTVVALAWEDNIASIYSGGEFLISEEYIGDFRPTLHADGASEVTQIVMYPRKLTPSQIEEISSIPSWTWANLQGFPKAYRSIGIR